MRLILIYMAYKLTPPKRLESLNRSTTYQKSNKPKLEFHRVHHVAEEAGHLSTSDKDNLVSIKVFVTERINSCYFLTEYYRRDHLKLD